MIRTQVDKNVVNDVENAPAGVFERWIAASVSRIGGSAAHATAAELGEDARDAGQST
jgi:hypothetical protein